MRYSADKWDEDGTGKIFSCRSAPAKVSKIERSFTSQTERSAQAPVGNLYEASDQIRDMDRLDAWCPVRVWAGP